MNILEVSNLKASYNLHTAIEDINMKVAEGEFICLVGENGSGKSTFIKTIIGMHEKDKGSIKLNIQPYEISYLEQNNMKDLNFPATAKEIIMTGVQNGKSGLFYTKNDNILFEEICNTLHIKNIVNKKIGDLSGGQRQRVMLARALILKPKLLIFDEPCSGLDIKITKELYNILEELNKKQGTTIIIATHDIDDFRDRDVRVIYISRQIKFDGKVKDWKGL